jgi:hypothetical protein
MALSKTLAIDDDVCDIFRITPQVVPQNLEGDAVYHAPLYSDGAIIAGGTIIVIMGAFVVDDLNQGATGAQVPPLRFQWHVCFAGQ